MAEPLKNHFAGDKPRRIADMIRDVYPAFNRKAFLADVMKGFDELELTPRALHVARALRRHLPNDYVAAAEILIASLGPVRRETEGSGMAPFIYMPHAFFVAEFGLDDFEMSMRANYEITKRFTSEFSVRPFLIHHQAATLKRLSEWIDDNDVHVRRLVSEGTRPRLPWAPRLKAFQKDPKPVLRLLERLKDDPELYVRRSVANNLNDIGKDHPEVLLATAKRWSKGADENRSWLIRHALRSLVKRGDAAALAILGYDKARRVAISNVSIPKSARIGKHVSIAFDVKNNDRSGQHVMVDMRIHYVKANGTTRPKVFKLQAAYLEPGETLRVSKRVSTAQMTTRTHYSGRHGVDAVVNGSVHPVGEFVLVA